MDIASIIASGLGLVVATVVLFVKRKAPAATVPGSAPAPVPVGQTPVFAALMAKIVGLVDELGLGDTDKHSLTQDLLNVVKEYIAPDLTPGDMGEKVKAVLDDFLGACTRHQRRLPPPCPQRPSRRLPSRERGDLTRCQK